VFLGIQATEECSFKATFVAGYGKDNTMHAVRVLSYAARHLEATCKIAAAVSPELCEKAVADLAAVRDGGGRLFILGVGGSAANASHAVNDFRKIAEFEAYAPTDNIAELTARTNDEGWPSVFVEWLRTSRLSARDGLLVLSVGGGSLEKNISANLVSALKLAKEVGARIVGIVGRDGGYTASVADTCIIIPSLDPENITPHAEAFQAVVWHLFVSHPRLKRQATKWEGQL
jgi:D-sedoheptulose 7-phosphate isomerase